MPPFKQSKHDSFGARQDSGCRITRSRRTYIHIRTQSRARARAVKTQPNPTFASFSWQFLFTSFHLVCLRLAGCVGGHFCTKSVIQHTNKGRQWRLGPVDWPFMLAGSIGPPKSRDEEPVGPTVPRPPLLRRSWLTPSGSSMSGSQTRRPLSRGGKDSPAPASVAGTNDTNSDGEKKAPHGGVKHPVTPLMSSTTFSGGSLRLACV